MTTAATYAEFAAREARRLSPTYERLSVAVSGDGEMLSLLGTLPPAKRQPNLLFGVVRFLGGPVDDPTAFHDYAVANWATIEAEMLNRATQTNEAGRCALLMPAALPQPLALGCRRVRRAVPVPRPVQLPLRRPADRRGRSDPRLRGHRDGAA